MDKPIMCEHFVEEGMECLLCRITKTEYISLDNYKDFITRISQKLNKILELVEIHTEDIGKRLQKVEKIIQNVSALEEQLEIAMKFAMHKAHELKKIDAKRDDVINLQNQKISQLESRIRGLEKCQFQGTMEIQD